MAIAERQRFDEALEWVRRIHDPSFTEWDAHLAWLEADPANGRAFDEASLMIESATVDLGAPWSRAASPPPTNDNMPELHHVRRRWTRWATSLGVAVAAGFAAVIALPSIMQRGAQPYVVQTKAGEQRSITLEGTTIALNGGSRLRLDHVNTRVAVLEQGEAYFVVRHDPAHPFAVQAGGATFQDVGTQFDVVQRTDLTQIAVREGAVIYDPGGASLRLDHGQTMRIADNIAGVQLVDAAAVGSWRAGRLLYRDAPLGDVAQDVARNIGEPVVIDPALAQRRFSGVVMIDPNRPLMFRRMAAVMGIDIRHAPEGWRMAIPTR